MRVRRLVIPLLLLMAVAARPARGADAPIAYTVRFDTTSQRAQIDATFPCRPGTGLELMMPIWSPGFYRVENYATRVRDLSARAGDGASLRVDQPRANRWRIDTCPASGLTVTYAVAATERSVTTNFVGADYAVLNGAPTFITIANAGARPHDVTIVLPAAWSRTMTALEPAPDRAANHYRAPDYETLVDSPILAGNPIVHEFTVDRTVHHLVEVGATGAFDGVRAAADLAKVVEAHRRLWGRLPFDRYYFLLAFRPGGGGLEHKASVLATTQAAATDTESSYLRWLNFISHEYLPRVQRQAAASGGARPVRLRARAAHDEPLDLGGVHELLRRARRHTRRPQHAGAVPRVAVAEDRAASDLARPSRADARAVVERRVDE